jgi:hypothetical protein
MDAIDLTQFSSLSSTVNDLASPFLPESLVFVDPRVANYEQLLTDLAPETKAIVLDLQQDGIKQISDILDEYKDIESLHILSHGEANSVQLGTSTLSLDALTNYRETLQAWSDALTDRADILLYGCNIAASHAGSELVDQLAWLTGADVAASTDITGATELGGNWHLEKTTGKIETNLPFFNHSLNNFDGLLATTTRVIGEVGVVASIAHSVQTISLNQEYDNPVVFAQPLSYDGRDPAIVRITDIQSDRFQAFVQEPNYKDVEHVPESFGYLVVEAGTWELENGSLLEVGTIDSNLLTSEGWETISLTQDFAETPLVFSQVQTDEGADFVKTRQQNATASEFQVAMEEEEALQASGHAFETLGWMAIPPGQGNIDGNAYIADRTGSDVTDNWYTVDFGSSLPASGEEEAETDGVPFLAAIASYNESDPAGLRYNNLSRDSVNIKIEEEISADSETNHAGEVVNFLAFATGGLLSAVGDFNDTEAPTAALDAPTFTPTENSVANYEFTVTYRDNTDIDVATLDDSDLRIVAPDGSETTATFLSIDDSTNGSPRTVTYEFAPPGGTWDLNESGTYQIIPATNQVSDTSGNFLATTELGSFDVSVADVDFQTQTIGEIGTLNSLDHNSQTIALENTYQNPVIFAQPLSYKGVAPATIRIENIESDNFTVKIQEPSNEDGEHVKETFTYLVLEAGSWELADGTLLEVGSLETDNLVQLDGWETVSLSQDFSAPPAVFSQVQTDNGPEFLRTRQEDTTTSSFQVALEEEERLATSGHTTETVGWLAVEKGTGSWDGRPFVAGYTGDRVSHEWYSLDFNSTFNRTPQFLASLASFDGPDSSGLRYQNLNSNNVQIKVEEDTSLDDEINHTSEDIAYLAVEGSGSLSAKVPTLPGPGELSFQHASFAVREDGTPIVEVTVIRENGNQGDVSATIELSNGTATNADYDRTSIEVSLADSEMETSVAIPLIDDSLEEDDETVQLSLTAPTGGSTLGSQDTATLVIAENDIPLPASSENVVFPSDAGVVDVRDYGAIPDDGVDDTAAIQAALDDHPSGNHIIYLSNGVYNISDQLTFAGSQKRNILQGQNRDQTIIKLDDNLGFTGSVIFTGTPPAQRFRNSIRNFTVDIGSGNPGATGISFMANNQGTLSDVKIVSSDGQGDIGLDLAPDENGPLLVNNVHIIGFDVGIRTLNPTASQTLENVRLEAQNEYGWTNFNQTVYVRNLQSINEVSAVWNQPDGASDFTLVGAELIGVGEAAAVPGIWNQKGMYAANVETSGYDLAILQDDKGRGNDSQSDGLVTEWIARGEFQSLFPPTGTMLNLPVSETPDVPWDALSDWASPLDFGGTPDDGVDDTDAIQAAIDSGASTVYLPNGVWNLDGTVELRGNVQRFLGTEADLQSSNQTGTIRLTDGTPSTVVVERLDAGSITFVHDSDRTLVMSSSIINAYENTSQGTGDLFVEDISGGPWTITNQDVWMRQINPETISSPRILNNGGNLWIFGYKTEDEGVIVETTNGGQTELIGAFLLNGDFGSIPAFINNESSLSFVSASYRSFNGDEVTVGVEETRGGVTRTIDGLPPYYTGF